MVVKNIGASESRQKRELVKLAVVIILLGLSFTAIYWFHHVKHTDALFTHLFYLPVILACLWWPRKGMIVALILALALPISHLISSLDMPLWEDIVRSFSFLVVAATVAALSLRRLNLEQELRDYSRTLEDRVEKKTEELKERNRELEAYSYTISHDLKAPLVVIEGFAELLEEKFREEPGEEVEEYLENIVKGVNRIRHLTDSLLEYASAGQPGGVAVEVDPNEIIAGILSEMETSIRRRGISVIVNRELPRIEVDPIKLNQVISNLLGNAIKYMGEKPSPEVEIGFEKRAGAAVIFVRDNGIGIPPDKQEAVFEPFKRFESAGEPGLGIGLSIVSRAVKGWGGDIWVQSSPGEGTAFYFTAPLAAARDGEG